MIDLMKKMMFTGIGYAVLTKDKVEELAQDFMEQGKLSQKEGEKFIEEVMQHSKEAQEDMSKKIESLVQEGLEKMNLAKMSDIEKLQDEITRLNERLQKLETGE